MAEDKSHLYFQNPIESTAVFKQKPRPPGKKPIELPKYYEGMKDEFRRCMTKFTSDRLSRVRARNRNIQIPHIDYIELTFFGPFDSTAFVPKYRQDFGFVPIKYSLFNTKVLFAINDETRFVQFFKELETFISTVDHSGELPYNVNIRFIKGFRLLTNDNIKEYDQNYGYIRFNLVESEEIFTNIILPVEGQLVIYLQQYNFRFELSPDSRTIQIWNIADSDVEAIISNFDIVHSVNSSATGIIGPSAFNLPNRDFGFNLILPDDNDPIIGILDSGIANVNALRPLLKNTNAEFDLTGTGSLVDNYDGGHGHGTGVAGLAAYGSKLIPTVSGDKKADAWLISLKIFEENTPRVSDNAILDLIRRAYSEKSVNIFVLTVTESISKKANEAFSAFAYSLDKLSHELDILICISGGNISSDYLFNALGQPIHNYPLNFLEEFANIKSPAESMNNFCIGACAGNFETGITSGISLDKDFPAVYSPKFHYDKEGIISSKQWNKHLLKPDLLYYGGDIDATLQTNDPGISHFSGRPGIFYGKGPGTSYSAPLIANLAARIKKQYPLLRMQSIKALILNAANSPKVGNHFSRLDKKVFGKLVGQGIPSTQEAIFSSPNSVTVVLEDVISPDTIKCFSVEIPAYLLDKRNKLGVLDITATICYTFEPVLNNQMVYCPVHIAFGIFNNLALESTDTITNEEGEEKTVYTGINGNSTKEISVRGQGWSEDYYNKRKLLSNVQKSWWSYQKSDIDENDNIFKLAVNCKRHKLLSQSQLTKYNFGHKFSLVLNFKERPLGGEFGGSLYDELQALNEFNLFTDLDADLDNTGEGIAEA
jgi:hypothetical protein